MYAAGYDAVGDRIEFPGNPVVETNEGCCHRSPGGVEDVVKGGNLRESAWLWMIDGVNLEG
jgi:hypothetical protein